jgi:serine/threonine-protein kinase PknG
MNCAVGGCSGQLEDGYCNLCGTKVSAPGSSLSQPLSTPMASGSTPGTMSNVPSNACVDATCAGMIEDGYCNLCGLKAGLAAGVAGSTGMASQATAPSMASVRSTRTATSQTRRTQTRRTATVRSRLGVGLVTIAPIPVADPSAALMVNATVSEDKRFCAACAEPVGRSKGERIGKDNGFCGKCGKPFDFSPKLNKGEIIGGQYEVAGALAHGGLGWIYLARDRNVSNRWVVLKGLLDSGDVDALAAAVAEQRFLASVEHPAIVKIFNVVQHDGAGYTVMEFVGGKSLKTILKDRLKANSGNADPLPPDQAIAYMLELLPAFSYLHKLGLIYCDLKPDNLIQQGDALKLIDLGGVRRIDDAQSAIYGTVGFQAPEIAEMGPSISSDLFTVGRTLATLCTDFRGYQSQYAFTLPPAADVPLYQRFTSLYSFLKKSTAPHPDDRFQTAEEMSEQLLGVLREVVAISSGMPVPAASSLFGPPPAPSRAVTFGSATSGSAVSRSATAGSATSGSATDEGETDDWAAAVALLPDLRIDPEDPNAATVSSLPTDPSLALSILKRVVAESPETRLAWIRVQFGASAFSDAQHLMTGLATADPWDWRADWWRGVLALRSGKASQAAESFQKVVFEVPGELAPKLAFALASEKAGNHVAAAANYEIVAATDPQYISATTGLIRSLSALGNRAGALTVAKRIPETSVFHDNVQLALVSSLMELRRQPDGTATLDAVDLDRASALVSTLSLTPEASNNLRVQYLGEVLAELETQALKPDAAKKVFGVALTDSDIRLGLEDSLRQLARSAPSSAQRIALVDRANAVRPRTSR